MSKETARTFEVMLKEVGIDENTKHHNYDYLYKQMVATAKIFNDIELKHHLEKQAEKIKSEMYIVNPFYNENKYELNKHNAELIDQASKEYLSALNTQSEKKEEQGGTEIFGDTDFC
jgi:hypothetical protein